MSVTTTTMHPRLDIVLGCMASGKSTELLRRVQRYRLAGKRVFVITYRDDTRYSTAGEVCTHNLLRESATAIGADELFTTLDAARQHDVCAIDESQFLRHLVDFVDTLLKAGVSVLVSGLDGTFQRRRFGETLDLIPLCDSILKLTAVCGRCREADAIFTRMRNESAYSGGDVCVGGLDMYTPVCRRCFDEKK